MTPRNIVNLEVILCTRKRKNSGINQPLKVFFIHEAGDGRGGKNPCGIHPCAIIYFTPNHYDN